MNVDGYMVRVSLEGDVLTAEGTNKASRVALAGQDHAAGPVVLQRSDITAVEYRAAGVLTNGRVTVRAGDRSYVLHFRRKQQAGFLELAQVLGATV